MMRKYGIVVMTALVTLTALSGCGGRNSSRQAEKELVYSYKEEEGRMNFLATDGSLWYGAEGDYAQKEEYFCVGEAPDALERVCPVEEDLNVGQLNAGDGCCIWSEWSYEKGRKVIRAYLADTEEVVTVAELEEDDMLSQKPRIFGTKVYYTQTDDNGTTAFYEHDLASGERTVLEEGIYTNFNYSVYYGDGHLFYNISTEENAPYTLRVLDLTTMGQGEITLPEDVSRLFDLTYDSERDRYALYFIDGSGKEHIGLYQEGGSIKAVYTLGQNSYLHHDRLEYRDGFLYWVTQYEVSGYVRDHYDFVMYDAEKDVPREVKGGFSFTLTEEGPYCLVFSADDSQDWMIHELYRMEP